MDPIADYLTRIRNAGLVSQDEILVPYSNIKMAISRVLKEEGYIEDFEVITRDDNKKDLKVSLKYYGGQIVIEGLKKISKCSCRIYVKSKEIPTVRGGLGIAVLSTSKGLMTGKKAKQENVGGELLCYVW